MRDLVKVLVLVILASLSVETLASTLWISPVHGSSSGYTLRSGIYITSDAGFNVTNGVTGGSGTVSNPYIIQGWEIDGGTTGIDVRYTSAYFVIRNVYVHGLSSGTGIYFLYVVHGSIENSTVSNNSNGIDLETSTYDLVANNHVTGNQEGILFSHESHYDSCINNTVTGTSSQGISVWQLAVNITVSGNLLTSNDWAIVVDSATNTTVIHNSILSNTLGIDESGAKNTWIVENNFAGDGEWIATYLSGVLYVFHNNFLSRTNSPGVYLYLSNDPPYLDDGYPKGGNFWYDYNGVDNCSGPSQNICPSPDGIGDTPYQIDLLDRDNYPLMKPYGPAPRLGPSWPVSSVLNASNIGIDSLTLTWNSAFDSLGVYRYRVYESGSIIANVSTTTFSVTGLLLGASYQFKIEAGDAWGNYTSNGPSLNVRVIAAIPVILVKSFWVGTPYAGGSTVIMTNFTNYGQYQVRVTGLTVSGDLGSWSLHAVPFDLASAESRVANMTISIPKAAYAGNHTVTITVNWAYYGPPSGSWNNAQDLSFYGTIPVHRSPSPPAQPSPPTIASQTGLLPIDLLLAMAGPLLVPGIAAYLTLTIIAIVLVARNRSWKKEYASMGRYCQHCGTRAGFYDVFCANCGGNV